MGIQHDYFSATGADDFFLRNMDAQRAERAMEGTTDYVVRHFQDRNQTKGNLAVLGGSAGAVSAMFQVKLKGFKVTNVDLSPLALEFGRQTFPELEHVQADIAAPNLADLLGHQDCLVLPTILCWIDRQAISGVVDNVRSILEPGGLLAIEDFFPSRPRTSPIKHYPSALTYKQDYADLFLEAGDFVLKKKNVWIVDDKDYELEDRMVGYALLEKLGDHTSC